MEWLYGIDTIAHKSTLENNGYTIAVLGSGFNNIFPNENISIYYEILNKDGLILSEYPPLEKAKSKNFLERNRIVSGLSRGILIIEAMYRSGTSVTARLAKEQGRKVFVLPHEINDKNGVGTNRLIREGAILVTNIKDIISEFDDIKYGEISEGYKRQKGDIENKLNIKEKSDKINLKQYDLENKERRRNKTENLETKKTCNNEEYKEIYKLIKETPITIEELILKTNKNLNEIYNILFMLEIEEYIEKVEGGYKCKN